MCVCVPACLPACVRERRGGRGLGQWSGPVISCLADFSCLFLLLLLCGELYGGRFMLPDLDSNPHLLFSECNAFTTRLYTRSLSRGCCVNHAIENSFEWFMRMVVR